MEALETDDTMAAPHRIAGRYTVIGLLGTGGMGAVYRARDEELDEIVALKMLRSGLVDAPAMLERFRAEVKLARKVTHRNVARTYDIGEHDGERFLTMELVEGESLSALLARERKLPVDRAIAIALDLAAGVGAAHAAGVLHRDLKPDNVLLEGTGRVVVTDFGIAYPFLEAAAGRPPSGLVGTPAYMAPEQVEGRGVDERTDLYALGEVLYEMLTGAAAWSGGSAVEVLAARLVRPPPDPRHVAPELSAPLAALVLRLMSRDPAGRPRTARDAANELRDAREADRAAAATVPLAFAASAAANVAASLVLPQEIARHDEKTVAVLPFKNVGAAADDYVADGLTEDLTDSLSMTRGLRVRARGALPASTAKLEGPQAIGRALGVQVIVDGSVRRVPKGYRLSARVIGVDDGFQLWSERFECSEEQLLVVSDEVARAVASALTTEIHASERGAVTDPAAIDAYLRARALLRAGWVSSDDTERAAALFEEALRRAPDDPTMIAGWAMGRARAVYMGRSAPEDQDEAKRAAERAVRAAPSRADGWYALAIVERCRGATDQGMVALRRALELAPTLGVAHEEAGLYLLEAGALDEAEERLRTALAIDPGAQLPRAQLARVAGFRAAWDDAERWLAGMDATNASAAFLQAMLRARFRLWRLAELGPATDPPRSPERTQFPIVTHIAHVLADGRLHASDVEAFEGAIASLASRPLGRTIRQFYAECLLAEGSIARAVDVTEAAVEGGLDDLAWFDRCPLQARVHASGSGELAVRWTAARETVALRAARVVAAWHGERR